LAGLWAPHTLSFTVFISATLFFPVFQHLWSNILPEPG
jgi:hypothetical protein